MTKKIAEKKSKIPNFATPLPLNGLTRCVYAFSLFETGSNSAWSSYNILDIPKKKRKKNNVCFKGVGEIIQSHG